MGRGTELTSPEYDFGMKVFGEVVKRHAKQSYTDVIHLPVEFPLKQDGHRPVSEAFRHKADDILLGTWRELGFNPIIIGGTIEERVDKIVKALDLDVSQTLEAGRREGDLVYFDKMDDVLGDSSKRFFSNGYRNTQHTIRDIVVNLPGREIVAKVDLTYRNGQWASKGNRHCTPHFSSIDSILVAGQLAQAYMYTLDGITRDQSSNMWLRDLQIRTGNKAIENCEGIPVSLKVESKYIERCGSKWHLASMTASIGQNGFRLDGRVGYEMPQLIPAIQTV